MNVLLNTILMTSAFATMGACSQTTVETKAEIMTDKKSIHAQPYAKPSAAVDFTHNFSGRTDVGVNEVVDFKIIDQYPGGTMDIEVFSSEGLQIFGNGLGQQSFALDSNSSNALSLQFQAQREGIHNISVVAKVTTADGQFITRSYSMPVYVGADFESTKPSSINKPESTEITQQKESPGLIIMEAEETIE